MQRTGILPGCRRSVTGTSLFDRLLESSGLAPPQTSTLANLLPLAPT